MKTPYPKTVKDHFLTGATFSLIENTEHGYLVTTPQPEAEDLGKYYESEEYLSHDDSKKGIFARLYRTVKKINLKSKTKLISNLHPKAKTILDVGCGTGDFLNSLPSHLTKTGVEVNAQAAKIAKEKGLKVLPSIEEVSGKFDVITLWHVFEHLEDPEKEIGRFKSLLQPKGVLLIAVPNYRSYDAQYYKSHWAGYDVPRHLYHFNRSSIASLVEAENLKVVKILPMYWDAYYVSLLSEKYLRNTLGAIKAGIIATLSNLKSLSTKETSSLIYIIEEKRE